MRCIYSVDSILVEESILKIFSGEVRITSHNFSIKYDVKSARS